MLPIGQFKWYFVCLKHEGREIKSWRTNVPSCILYSRYYLHVSMAGALFWFGFFKFTLHLFWELWLFLHVSIGYSFLFLSSIPFVYPYICVYTTRCYLFTCWQTVGLFSVGGYYSTAAINFHAQVFMWMYAFISVDKLSRKCNGCAIW